MAYLNFSSFSEQSVGKTISQEFELLWDADVYLFLSKSLSVFTDSTNIDSHILMVDLI